MQGGNLIFGGKIDEQDTSNLIYIGKVIERSSGSSMLGSNCWLDINFPHVIYITGTRGTGKSFDLGVIIEGISSLKRKSQIQHAEQLPASILIDTQNQFWTLKYQPNKQIDANNEQLKLLEKWNIDPNALSDCDIYIPKNSQKITGDEKIFFIDPMSVNHEEWCSLVDQEVYSPQGHIIRQALKILSEYEAYDLEDIIGTISNENNFPNVSDNARNALTYKLEDIKDSNLFHRDGLDVKSMLMPGKCNIFMLRDIQNSDKALITGIIARQLFKIMGDYHTKKKVNSFFEKKVKNEEVLASKVWLLIDEAHVVAPTEGQSAARNALIEYVKRGRDAGLSLVLATQQPSAVDDKILSQVNLSLSHRLTFDSDSNACINRIPTTKLKKINYGGKEISDFSDMISLLGPGQCFVGDSHTSRVITVSIRPRSSSHGGYSPK